MDIPDQYEILFEMVSTWRRDHSDLRFGQWVWNVCGGDPFYIEDDEMVERMRKFIADNEIR